VLVVPSGSSSLFWLTRAPFVKDRMVVDETKTLDDLASFFGFDATSYDIKSAMQGYGVQMFSSVTNAALTSGEIISSGTDRVHFEHLSVRIDGFSKSICSSLTLVPLIALKLDPAVYRVSVGVTADRMGFAVFKVVSGVGVPVSPMFISTKYNYTDSFLYWVAGGGTAVHPTYLEGLIIAVYSPRDSQSVCSPCGNGNLACKGELHLALFR